MARVYKHLQRRPELFGLEAIDAVLLAAFAWLLLTFFRDAFFWNALLVCLGYAVLRIGKRGKPPGFTTALVRFFAGPKRFQP